MLIQAVPLRAAELDDYAAEIFTKTHNKLKEMIELYDTRESYPDSSWIPFRRDKKKIESEIDVLIDEALAMLEISKLTDYRKEYIELRDKVAVLNKKIDKLRRKMVIAPEEESPLDFWSTSKEDYQKKIDRKKRKIERIREEQEEIVEQIRLEFKNIGIDVEDKQIRFFLSTISEENIFSLSAVFHNVKQINGQFAQLVKDTGEDVEAARSYFGMYMLMVKILIRAHDHFIQAIDQDYTPRVGGLLEDNRTLKKETEKLLGQERDRESIRLLRSNLKAQETTEKAGRLYLRYLSDQRERLTRNREPLHHKYAVAQNTYKTAKIAASLITIIDSSIKDLTTLLKMELPEMIPFENAELQKKFEEITTLIKKEE